MKIKSNTIQTAALFAALGIGSAEAQLQGPSSSQSAYVIPTHTGVTTRSIMTVGDSVNLKPDGITPYRMVGIPDGLGAYDNGDGTFTLVMNHELPVNVTGTTGTPVGGIRAHGNASAFVSRWTIAKATLQVLKVEDLIQNNVSIFLSNNNPSTGVVHTAFLPGGTTPIGRLCTRDLTTVTAYSWTDPDTGVFYGTTARIFQSGEEMSGIATSITGGGNLGPKGTVHYGRQFNWILTDDPNIPGDQSRTGYEMPHCGLFDWENNLANPLSQRKTIVAGMDDTNPGGQVYFWVGEKQTTGNVVERAGLTRQSANDNLYVVKVNGLTNDATGATLEDRGSPLNGTFALQNEGDVSGLTFGGLEDLSNTKGATKFLRPEDGNWDPSNPRDYYFVTTDRLDTQKDGVGTQAGRSRLYRLRFTDISQPELGGAITCLLNGTEAGNMFDNITIDRHGRLLLQEDVGNAAHNGKIWMYEIATSNLVQLAKHDPSRFGDLTLPATAPYNQDEESSGIIDVSEILGPGAFLLDVQAHYTISGELVEGGQLLVMYVDIAPEITCPNSIIATNDPGQCGATVAFAATAQGLPAPVLTYTVEGAPIESPFGFPKGTTLVTCTASNYLGVTNCTFTVPVVDGEAPAVACRPAPNPSGKNVPGGKNPNPNPNGFFQVLASDNCDSNPAIYIADSASAFIAGPFVGGDVLKLTTDPSGTPIQKKM